MNRFRPFAQALAVDSAMPLRHDRPDVGRVVTTPAPSRSAETIRDDVPPAAIEGRAMIAGPRA